METQEAGAEAQMAAQFGYPRPPSKDTIFKFFRYIIGLDDSSKIGNLSKTELGDPKLSVRDWQSISKYAEAENLPQVSRYLMGQGEITLATSSSYKGFLAKLFVTQIKREQKATPGEPKKGWFQKKDNPDEKVGE